MELTEEQQEYLVAAGINPTDLEGDAAHIVHGYAQADRLLQGMTSDNIAISVQSYFGLMSDHLDYEKKYNDPRVEKLLENAVKEDAKNMGLPDGWNAAAFQKKISQFEEQSQDDPALAEKINQQLEPIKEELLALAEQVGRKRVNLESNKESMSGYYRGREIQDALKKVGDEDISELRELFDKADTARFMNLTDKETMQIYENFLKAYLRAVHTRSSGSTPDAVKFARNEVDRMAGIPPEIFADKGTHYMLLKAKEIKELADKARSPEFAGSFDSYEEFVRQKKELLTQAQSKLLSPTGWGLFNFDPTYLEKRAGYSNDYLDGQIELLSDEQERIEEYHDVGHETEGEAKWQEDRFKAVDDPQRSDFSMPLPKPRM